MIENGFVKLPRNIVQKPWYKEQNTLQLYIVLLLNAAFKDVDRGSYTVRAGQYVTSRSKLMEMTGLTERQTKTAISHLKASGDITVVSNTRFSVITLNNYGAQPSVSSGSVLPDDPQGVPQNVRRSISNEDNKEEIKEEAAVPHFPDCYQSENSFNAPLGANKQSLIEMYGEAAVQRYENKFRAWADARNAIGVPMYSTIAKWLAQDCVPKASEQKSVKKGCFDTERLKRAVMETYKRA